MTHPDSTMPTEQNAATSAEAHGWVAVCESLPEMGTPVLAVLDTRVEILIRMKSQGVEGRWGWFRLTPGNGFSADWVKYWMPLPKPPNDRTLRPAE